MASSITHNSKLIIPAKQGAGKRHSRSVDTESEAEQIPLQQALYAESDRFRPSRLGPVDDLGTDTDGRAGRVGGKQRDDTFRQRPLRFIDKALLVVEVTGAVVVGWLVLQYVYTVYFDTAPRRVTPPGTGTSAGRVAGGMSRATPSATRFVELAPPLFGGPSGEASVVTGTQLPDRATPTVTPTVALEMRLPSRLRIPAMFLDSPVHEVTVNMGTWEVAPMDIGHHHGTANPGEVGNMVLAGHRDINSALFRELDRLDPGDEVFVSNSLGEYRYVVIESMVVSPEHVEVMDPTDDSRLTLITCTPIGLATQRLVVTAMLDRKH